MAGQQPMVLEVTGELGPRSRAGSPSSPLVDRVQLRLSGTGIEVGKQKLILSSDIAGLESLDSNSITVHAYPRKALLGCLGGVRRGKEDHTLYFSDPQEKQKVMQEWRTLFGRGARGLRLLVLLNPFSGTKKAVGVWRNVVQKVFVEAGAEVTVVETERMGHACEVVQMADLGATDGIVCVSGDGLIAEVVNGLLQRPDVAQAKRVALGFIPAGSGNGLAMSVLHNGGEGCDPLSAALAIVRGRVEPMDVASVMQFDQVVYRSVLSIEWGLISDTDILSDSMRWLGSARFTVQALQLVARKKLYEGKIKLLTPEAPSPGIDAPANSPLNSIVDGWTVIEGKFALVWAMNCTHAASDMFTAPRAKLNDGCFDVLVIRGHVSRAAILGAFIALESGKHVDNKEVEYYKAKELTWEPAGTPSDGTLAMDGELVACGDKMKGRLPAIHRERKLPMQYSFFHLKVNRGALSAFSAATTVST